MQPSDELYLSFINRANEIASAQEFVKTEVAPGDFVVAQAPFEYWQWMAVLFDNVGTAYALQQRFVRLRVKDAPALPTSKWQFSEVMALDYQLTMQNNDQPLLQKELAQNAQRLSQRVALDLAGADSMLRSVWLGAYRATASEKQNCKQSFDFTTPQLSATFTASHCASLEDTKNFTVSRGAAMLVNGQFRHSQGQINLTGHGWFVHGWGVPPAINDNAVLLDRAWLILGEQQDIQLLRSRRRSGRGQALSNGTVRSLGAEGDIVALDAQWQDAQSAEAQSIPDAWQLQSDAPEMDLTITPLNQINQPAYSDALPWFNAVLVRGSQTGFGFIEYVLQ